MGHIERIKIMKLLWDATGTEFGGRHALYELNYAGAPEEVRLQVLKGAERGGRLKAMEELVDSCMADYDEHGWTGSTWLPPLSGAGA
jgi:4-hydroxyphenylacetate 3-monooxygenase